MLEVEIPLTGGYYTTIDAVDLGVVGGFKWSAAVRPRSVYAEGWVGGAKVFMHRLLLKPPKGMQSDHRDHNGLNNVRGNLRVCTRAENQRNRRPSLTGTSEYLGVSWEKNRNRWRAQITTGGKSIKLGRFLNEIYAAGVYDTAAKELHGEFARLNFPDS